MVVSIVAYTQNETLSVGFHPHNGDEGIRKRLEEVGEGFRCVPTWYSRP